ncbi:MAG TPA: hypothetical protein VHG27_08720 [Xanthobacteraceae bacterium]|nr:hypothetical protein [Xanthobacteraceae bacterium]
MPDPANALTLQFLAWVAERPRPYGETMEAWRTSCPRLSIWEDAVRDSLVALDRTGARSMKDTRVVITPRGRALLQAGRLAAEEAPEPRLAAITG